MIMRCLKRIAVLKLLKILRNLQQCIPRKLIKSALIMQRHKALLFIRAIFAPKTHPRSDHIGSDLALRTQIIHIKMAQLQRGSSRIQLRVFHLPNKKIWLSFGGLESVKDKILASWARLSSASRSQISCHRLWTIPPSKNHLLDNRSNSSIPRLSLTSANSI